MCMFMCVCVVVNQVVFKEVYFICICLYLISFFFLMFLLSLLLLLLLLVIWRIFCLYKFLLLLLFSCFIPFDKERPTVVIIIMMRMNIKYFVEFNLVLFTFYICLCVYLRICIKIFMSFLISFF